MGERTAHPRRHRAQSLFHRRHPICLPQKARVGGGAEKGDGGEMVQSVPSMTWRRRSPQEQGEESWSGEPVGCGVGLRSEVGY